MVDVKFIKGYEGLYFIDTLGNVVSLPKSQGRYIHNKYKILTPRLNKEGYYVVYLNKNHKTTTFLLHRLMAQSFIDNPNNYDVVNHINGIKTDNRLENLEWCLKQYNTQHAFQNNLGNFKTLSLTKLALWNAKHSYSKVILTKDNLKYEFNNTNDAAKFINTTRDEITRAIRKQQHCKGWNVFGLKSANGEILIGKAKDDPVGKNQI